MPIKPRFSYGYSGRGPGRNNPNDQTPFQGPIPQGSYTTGRPRPGGHMGPNAIPLIPSPETASNMSMPARTPLTGRNPGTFFIHGNNPTNDASEGCIILPADRTRIPPGETVNVNP